MKAGQPRVADGPLPGSLGAVVASALVIVCPEVVAVARELRARIASFGHAVRLFRWGQSQAMPSPSRSRSYGSSPSTRTGPDTYAGPLPPPPAQSTSLDTGTQGR